MRRMIVLVTVMSLLILVAMGFVAYGFARVWAQKHAL